jgi:large subunit ribosomal protein L29
MRASKFREQSVEELRDEERKLKEQIFKLRFQLAIGQAENPMRLMAARKDLARVKTILGEKRRAASGAAAEGKG